MRLLEIIVVPTVLGSQTTFLLNTFYISPLSFSPFPRFIVILSRKEQGKRGLHHLDLFGNDLHF